MIRVNRKDISREVFSKPLIATFWSIVLLLFAVPAAAAVPSAPTIGEAWYERGGATVNFTPPASDGGISITGYTVTPTPADGSDSNAGSPELSHVVTGLTFGKAYTFSVTATNTDGISSSSAQSFPVTARPYSPTNGTINNIVVFIRFSGQPEFSQPLSYYDSIFNAPPTSLKSFYLENSYNNLTVNSTFYPLQNGSTAVSFQDNHPVSYYKPYNATTNVLGYQSGTEQTARSVALVTNTMNAVAALIQEGLNLDVDSDGFVDHITFEVYSTNADPIPVMFSSKATFDTTGTITLKGKKVGSYTWVTAPQDSTYSAYSLAAVEIHEMGHNLGFPDLRNNFNGYNPVGNWDFMANAYGVVHNGAYMKQKIGGWISSIPAIASTAYGTYTINDITQSTNNSYKITLPNTNEFLIFEYRPATGAFESRLPGKGLCISRVNEVAGLWGNMNGNPASAPIIPFYLYYFRPGGTFLSDGSAANLFTCLDAAAGQTQFNDFSNPACFLSNGSPCGISLYDIGTVSGSSISFKVGDPAATTVTHLIKGNITYSNNSRVVGATVTLSGDANGVATTALGGGQVAYQFTVNAGGNYTVTPKMANMLFNPPSASVSNITSDQALNFTATKITKTISGMITSAGTPLSGATVNIYSTTGTSCSYYVGNTITTSASGIYVFTVDAGSSCDVIASKTGLSFTPTGYKTFTNIAADQVQDFATNVTVCTSTVNPSDSGQGVIFTATVFGNSPTGTMTFTDGGTVLCSLVALSAQRKANCGPLTALAAGNHTIVAAYSGDGNNPTSSSSTLTQIVKMASSTVLGSSMNPSYSGQNVTFTAAITGITQTGTVTFSAGSTEICTAVALTNGQAQCSINTLAMGSQNIVAVYSGNGTNTGSSTSTLAQVVKLPLPTIQAAPDTTGTVGLPYVFWINATDTTSITVSDPVPPGFNVVATADPNVWKTDWTPATTGIYSNIILTAHNSDWQTLLLPFTVTIKLPVPTIDGHPATIGMVRIPYSTFTPTLCDLNIPHFTTCYATSFSLSGTLPPGLKFDTTTGVISGTPITAGTYSNLIVSAINSEGSKALPAFNIKISPRIDAFTSTHSMTTARQYHTATTLQNGKVLVTGGIDVNSYTPLASAELFDPATENWSSIGSMSIARTNHAATLLKDGRVLVTGGYGSAGLLNSVELYDTAVTTGNPWTTVNPMVFGHSSHSATMLSNPDGTVLVMGGFNPDPDYPDTIVMVELYNPNTNTWTPVSQMTEARSGFTATLLPGGKVLVAGGGNTISAQLYDPLNDPYLNSSIDPNSNPWSATAHPMIVNRSSHTATALVNGKVLISSGINISAGNEISSAELFDPVLGTWSATGSMSAVRQSHAATLLTDGAVLVTGGVWRNSFLSNAYHAFAELYNPTTEVWSTAGFMATPRTFHSTSLLPNGDVLVAGGSSDYKSVLASSELYHYFYTVSFNSNGGSAVTSQRVTYNSTATTPENPVKTGYSFAGWYSDSGLTVPFDFSTGITSDIMLFAKWTDAIAPILTVFSPEDNSKTAQSTITIAGTINETATVTVKNNSGTVQNTAITGSNFSATINLASGLNTITITATDLANNTTSVVRTITYDNSNPLLTITNPAQDMTTTLNSVTISGTVSDTISTVTISISAEGQTYTPTVDANSTFSQSIVLTTDKAYAIVVTATDQVGNTTTGQRNIIKLAASIATGDITGDGKVDILDALKVLRISVELETATTAQLAVADVAPLSGGKPSPDGKLNIADAVVILEKAVGLINW